MRLIFLFTLIILFKYHAFSQKPGKVFYFENTLSPFNIIPKPGSGLKPEYWVRGNVNSIMIKAGLNTTHVLRLGYSTYGANSIISGIIKKENHEYSLFGDEFRMGYQYNFKNNTRRSVPFVSADLLYSDFREENTHVRYTKDYVRTITNGLILSIGLKQKISSIIVLNIESGFLAGKMKSTHTLNFYSGPILDPVHNYSKSVNEKSTIQFYPIKIGLGVRIGDYKRKRHFDTF